MSLSNEYSFIDRMLHYLAFSTPVLQKVLGELENDLFSKEIVSVQSQNEVFVTSLPRAGTTLVLNLLYNTGEFASYTYRQMPFMLAPLLWQRLSAPFQQQATLKERAHGDGMEVSYDSPEAFEEILWLAYLAPRIVNNDRLNTLTDTDIDPEFKDIFSKWIKKCLLLARDPQSQTRYLSKNNANISRIPLIRKMFPTARMVIPFRHPLAHVSSVIKQHDRFLDEHEQDQFSKNYMAWLGHFEFGLNVKPIDFNGWLTSSPDIRTLTADFWLQCWTAAYTFVIQLDDPEIIWVDFEKLLSQGSSVLTKLSDDLALKDPSRLIQGADSLRAPTTKPVTPSGVTEQSLSVAMDVYGSLQKLAGYR